MNAMEDVLLRTLEDGVLTLTLNRPEKLNALTIPMMHGLLAAMRRAAIDPGVRAVVLTGAGRGFCAGGDVRGAVVNDPHDPVAAEWGEHEVWDTIEQRADRINANAEAAILLHTIPKPTIAMVRGPCAGAGLSLASACDLRVVSDTALFTTAFSSIARSGDYGGSYFLTKLLGSSKARELYLLSEKFGAEEAHRIGLANRVVADDRLEAETMALALRLARGPAAAYRYIKRNINAAETQTVHEVLSMEGYHMVRTSFTEDAKEYAVAMQERREPVYRGF
jgi:2-(1,2-epoxy-1,2-dihydrophenyl)acetyl-CoA isomerase